MSRPLSIKLVVVGDGTVGKTCMLYTYSHKKFIAGYVPTVFDNWTACLKVQGQNVNMELWDTAGQEDYDRLRPLSYPQTDIFLVCFSVVSPVSLKNAREKWIPEIKHHCPDATFILIGTKIDLRDDKSTLFELSKSGESPVKKEEGSRVAHKVKAYSYLECSALTQQGLIRVFEDAARAVICPESRQKPSHKCAIM